MEAARARGQRHVVIDPRRTETADAADIHLPLAPQTDVRLWNGLLADLIRRGAADRTWIADHVAGFKTVLASLATADQSHSAIASDCGVDEDLLRRFYTLFAETPRTVSLFSMGANQSAQGVAKGSAIINAHLATGRIGKPGACPFSITGQPNAMGGREVGGLANMLACHLDIENPTHRAAVQTFWHAPRIADKPGLKAVDLFRAVEEKRIKALWIMCTNPSVSLPRADKMRGALGRLVWMLVTIGPV